MNFVNLALQSGDIGANVENCVPLPLDLLHLGKRFHVGSPLVIQ
jgi:hypothetical protein